MQLLYRSSSDLEKEHLFEQNCTVGRHRQYSQFDIWWRWWWGSKTLTNLIMGNADTKLHFRKAVIQLTTKTQPVDVGDDDFWDQFWSDSVTTVQDVFTLLPSAEIR